MTLPFDHTHDLGLGVSRSESEIALSEEWVSWLTWNKEDVSHPFITMILTFVTMVGWGDVLDNDQDDFRRWCAIDISSCSILPSVYVLGFDRLLNIGGLKVYPIGYIHSYVVLSLNLVTSTVNSWSMKCIYTEYRELSLCQYHHHWWHKVDIMTNLGFQCSSIVCGDFTAMELS